MDSLIASAARALSVGDPLAALKRIALRNDAPALALRGIAMAQLGERRRARQLLRSAARAFGSKDAMARARCVIAEAEVALVSRDLGWSSRWITAARAVLAESGDRTNAAHAGYLEARRLLLIGRLDEAEAAHADVDVDRLPPASRVGHELVTAGIAIRRIRTGPARAALARAAHLADIARIPALSNEVDQAVQAFKAPAARLITQGAERRLRLDQVETLLRSNTLVVDACRSLVCAGATTISLASRPVLLALVRALAQTWPEDAARDWLVQRAFRASNADETHRARLRVEIARLREIMRPLATLNATKKGFALRPLAAEEVAVLAPATEGDHAELLALLGDGQAWSSSALALALNVGPRTVQRALVELALDGKVVSFGRGRACRWTASSVPGFPTSLLLPAARIFG